MVLVLGSGQPALLTLAFALKTAVSLGTELLMMSVSAVGLENSLTTRALHEVGRIPNLQPPITSSSSRPHSHQEDPRRKKEEEISDEVPRISSRKKTAFSNRPFYPTYGSPLTAGAGTPRDRNADDRAHYRAHLPLRESAPRTHEVDRAHRGMRRMHVIRQVRLKRYCAAHRMHRRRRCQKKSFVTTLAFAGDAC